VFRDTIEFRGVPFLWLPDLSQPDPFYIVPVLMGASMFLLQWIGQRSMPQSNPQMKMMMWIMPIMLTVLFLNFASGLNLYYATMNLASLPQQMYLTKKRKAVAAQPPPSKKAKAPGKKAKG
jgi:YidC/Oxa1 family membrane protein insertase